MLGNITGGRIELIKSLYLKSPIKCKILLIIIDNAPISILEIKKKLASQGDEYNYRTIWQHVQNIEKDGTIFLNKMEHESGKPVKVYLGEYAQNEKEQFKEILKIPLDSKKLEYFKREQDRYKMEMLDKIAKELRDNPSSN